MAVSIPEDHPVRKLFQRFRQQRDTQTSGDTYIDNNCIQVEAQHHHHHHHHHHHTDSNSYTRGQQQQEHSSTVHTNAPCSGGGSPGNTAALPQAEQSCTQKVVESRLSAKSLKAAARSGAGGERAAGSGSSNRGARGWAKFRNATSAPEPAARPPVEQEKQTQKAEQQIQEAEEGGETGSTEGGNSAGEETSALHKTDSCDSGITKSDLRIDRAGDSRSSFERSPMEKSPMEKNPFEHSLGVYSEISLKHSFVQPASEQALLQTTLHEAKLELKGDIQILSGRLSLLESHVSEILRLLSIKRRLSLPPTSSPKARVKIQDTSRPVTHKKDEGPF